MLVWRCDMCSTGLLIGGRAACYRSSCVSATEVSLAQGRSSRVGAESQLETVPEEARVVELQAVSKGGSAEHGLGPPEQPPRQRWARARRVRVRKWQGMSAACGAGGQV